MGRSRGIRDTRLYNSQLARWYVVIKTDEVTTVLTRLALARAIAAQCVALGLVVVFQVLVLRTPARRLAREALARIVYANLSYYSLLSAYFRAGRYFRPQTYVPTCLG